MKIRILFFLGLTGIFFLNLGAEETVYKAGKVLYKGWIQGRVTHSAANLDVPKLEVNYDQKACGAEPRNIQAVEIGVDGALRNSVVYLKSVTNGKPFNLSGIPPTLSQDRCDFNPHVQVVPPKSSLKLINNDGLLHSVHAFHYEYGRTFVIYPNSITYPANTLFNIAMVSSRRESFQQLNAPGIVKFICDAGHYWMTAYAVVMNHPYYVKVNDDGTYKLDDVPAGKYTLVCWHEYFGTKEQTITVKENQPAQIDFVYSEEL